MKREGKALLSVPKIHHIKFTKPEEKSHNNYSTSHGSLGSQNPTLVSAEEAKKLNQTIRLKSLYEQPFGPLVMQYGAVSLAPSAKAFAAPQMIV